MKNKIMIGEKSGENSYVFKLQGLLTRAEAAQLLYNVMMSELWEKVIYEENNCVGNSCENSNSNDSSAQANYSKTPEKTLVIF